MSTATLPQRHEIPEKQTWNLGTIYATDAAWEQDFQRVAGMLPRIGQYTGRLGSSAQTLLEALSVRDEAGEILGKLFVYANMRWHENTANSTYQALADRVTTLASDFGAASAYFTPEILAIPQDQIESFLRQEPKLQVYRHALDEINRMRPHVLTPEIEALLAQASELGSGPERTYEMLTNADLKLPAITDENGEVVQITQGNYVSRFLENPNRELRQRAFEAMLGTYAAYRNTFAATLAGQVKTDLFFARSRHYDSALEAALDPNNIPVGVYDSLVETVHQNLPKLHRYLHLRKRLLGLDDLHMYDLYVPMVERGRVQGSL